MPEFREIADAEQAQSRARLRVLKARRQAALSAAKRAFEADVSLLAERVLPLLLEAGQACSAVGAPPQMQDNFAIEMTLHGAPPAMLEFWCAGPIRRSRHGSAMIEPKGEKIELRCYRGSLTIGGDSFEQARPVEGDPKPLIEEALVTVLRSYFREVEALETAGRT